jgi:protein-S-isoprenylcysteine O-methyltransferase Ste14
MAIVTALAGGVSLLLFGLFIFGLSFTLIEFADSSAAILIWDSLLCLLFFLQHSIMIRRGFRRRLAATVPDYYHGAIYTLASAVAIFILLLLWQNSGQTIVNLQGVARWIADGVFFASLLGMLWSMYALRSLDMLGIQPILNHIGATGMKNVPLLIRGPYRWMRHPAYFFILLMIWYRPDITLDRLLFNLLFTGWIVLGTILEERDLVAEFGESYVDYQSKVPMLIPWRPYTLYSPDGTNDQRRDND